MLVHSEPQAHGKILGERSSAYMHDEEIASIRSALRIADRLQSGEVSEGMVNFGTEHASSGCYAMPDTQTSIEELNKDAVTECFKAMAVELIKEVESDR